LRLTVIASLLLETCVVGGCSQELDKPILFTVPKGFQGLIALTVDANKGAEVDDLGQLYELRIPEDGRLSLRSIEIFHSWHKVFAEYEDGMPIPVAARIENDSIVAFHGLPLVSYHKNGKEQVLYYFVGTKAESDKARQDLR